VCLVIDKKGKVTQASLKEMLREIGLSQAAAGSVLEVLQIETLDEAERLLVEANADLAPLSETRRVFDYLSHYGLGEFCRFDISVVRGLLYYTGPVFEFFDAGRKFRAICGGGRYDNLLESYGGGKVTAVGLGFGDVVITEVLADKGLLPDFSHKLDYVVIPFSDEEREVATKIAQSLRSKGKRVSMTLETKKLRKALAEADKAGGERVVIVAPDELAVGKVVVRNMRTGEEEAVLVEQVC
jgi:histidyl-tRNA synthetase